MVRLVKVHKTKPSALVAAVAHHHCAGYGAESAKDRAQDFLVHITANISDIDVAKLSWLSCSILQVQAMT